METESITGLGNCYCKGEGVSKDLVEAAKWYQKAAEQGHTEAQDALGRLETNQEEKKLP